jgi:hypothetical protein
MLYTPLPGTSLYEEHRRAGTLLGPEECPESDVHGQQRFNFRHPRIPAGEETGMLLRAFTRDFDRNGPSVLRVVQTLLAGWRQNARHADPRVRERIRRECRGLATTYAGALWAAERWLHDRPELAAAMRRVRREIVREFGWRARVAAPLIGAFVRAAMSLEARRLRRGRPDEPPTFYEANASARPAHPKAAPCRAVGVEAAVDRAPAPRLPALGRPA